MREPQRFLLGMQLRGLAAIERDLEALIDAQLEPVRPQHRLLMQIPGVDRVTAAVILAEIGTEMDAFATARRLAAWAGVAPGNYESAGKPKRSGTRKGNMFLKSALFAAAAAAVKTKGSYYRDKYNRLCARRGPMRALGHRPQATDRRLPDAGHGRRLPRPRRGPPRPGLAPTFHGQTGPAPEQPRLRRHAGAEGGIA